MPHVSVRTILFAAASFAAILALAPAAGAACANQDLTWSAATEAQMVDSVTCLVNAERTARGLPALRRDGSLDAAARGHSADMADNDYFDHDSLDGTKFSARIAGAGYAWISAGENIAAGQRTARSVMSSWMASEGHCKNILSGSYADIGVGLATGPGTYWIYWTQDFGRRSGAGASSTAAAGCPFKSLVSDSAGAPAQDTPTCTNYGTTSVKIKSLRRAAGGRIRIAGSVRASGCCPSARIKVKRGRRTTSATKRLCGSSYVVKIKLPKTRGNARVSVRLGSDGPSARRTLKL